MSTVNPTTILSLMLQSIGYTGDESGSCTEVKNPTEAVALFAHSMMLAAGFRLVGFNEEDRFGKSYDAESKEPLPKEWNAHSTPSFRYAHTQSSLEYLVKVSRLGHKTVVLAMALQDDKTATFEITTRDYFSESFFPFSRASGKELKEGFISDSRFSDLISLFKINIVQRLIPGLNKPGFEEVPTTVNRQGGERNEPRRPEEPYPDAIPRPYGDDPLRIPRPRPIPAGGEPVPGFDDEYDLLRGPRGGGYPGGRNPLSIGDDDLNPPGLGPNTPLRGPFFGEGGYGGGFPAGGGGMHPTPDHPMFGGRGGGQGHPDLRAPPGARYDPTGPWDETPPNLRGPRGPGGNFGPGGGFGGGFGGFGGGDFI